MTEPLTHHVLRGLELATDAFAAHSTNPLDELVFRDLLVRNFALFKDSTINTSSGALYL